MNHLDKLICQSAINAVVQARLSFRDEVDARMSSWCVRDETTHDRRSTHLTLLHTLPTIWMTEHDVDAIANGCP